MMIFITVLMLNVWAISADEVLSLNINITEELGKIKTMETKMKSLETEMERLRAENTAPKLAFSAAVLTSFEPQNILKEFTKIKTMEEKLSALNDEVSREYKSRTKALTTNLKKLEEKTDASERGKVAFSATLSALGNSHKFIGPYKEATSLVYENALTNIGNAYDTNTGIFTAPVKGVYYFNFVVFNPHGMPTGVKLLKNGNFVVGATDNPPGLDTEDTASNAVSLLLEQGDRIHLQLWENRRIYTDGNRRNTFSGHLLFTM